MYNLQKLGHLRAGIWPNLWKFIYILFKQAGFLKELSSFNLSARRLLGQFYRSQGTRLQSLDGLVGLTPIKFKEILRNWQVFGLVWSQFLKYFLYQAGLSSNLGNKHQSLSAWLGKLRYWQVIYVGWPKIINYQVFGQYL